MVLLNLGQVGLTVETGAQVLIVTLAVAVAVLETSLATRLDDWQSPKVFWQPVPQYSEEDPLRKSSGNKRVR